MDIIKIDFSPGSLADPTSSPFIIPIAVWENVNTFLTAIANVDYDIDNYIGWALAPTNQIYNPDNFDFSTLKQFAARWVSSDYPNLKLLAQHINTFGATTIPAGITQLQQVSPKFQNGTYSPGDISQFKATVKTLGDAAYALSNIIQNLNIDAQQTNYELSGGTVFLAAVALVKEKFDPKNYQDPNQDAQNIYNSMIQFENTFNWNNFNTAFQCFSDVAGTLSTLTSEFDNANTKIDSVAFNNNPFEVDGSFDVAQSDWQQVAMDAQNFIASLPA
ncbi:MAG: hypothetical protein KDC34_17160 [Saprospiraceae bacterium]|nr:hypothetical protein [Saprospiraceae bacterium]